MTVPFLPSYKVFIGSGSTGPFTFAFPFYDPSNIVVVKTNLTTQVSQTLVPNIDYTLTGVSGAASVTLPAALPTGYSLTISRILPIEQDASLPNGGPFFSVTVETEFDYLTMLIQQLQAEIDLGLSGSTPTPTPTPSGRDLGVLGTDPVTTGWGLAQSGYHWFDLSSGNEHLWNGTQVVEMG